jgi:hypothetical protein
LTDNNDTDKLRIARVKEERESGPLDIRYVQMDPEEMSFPPERSFARERSFAPERSLSPERSLTPQAKESAIHSSRFTELMDEFRIHISMPDLEMDEQNCCSIEIGNNEHDTLLITIEMRDEGDLLLFTTLENYPNGVSDELAARVEMISTAIEEDGYYLTTSRHNVFLCAQRLLRKTTSTQFVDWMADFHRQGLVWRNRYRTAVNAPVVAAPADSERPRTGQPLASGRTDPNVSASLRISPSQGLKV